MHKNAFHSWSFQMNTKWNIRLTGVGQQKWLRDDSTSSCGLLHFQTLSACIVINRAKPENLERVYTEATGTRKALPMSLILPLAGKTTA